MDAAAIAGHRRVTFVGKPARVAVVPDRQDVLELLVGDDGSDLQAHAGRALGELLGHAHVHLVERYPIDGHRRIRGYQVVLTCCAHATPCRDRSPGICRAPAAARARYRSRMESSRWSAP